MIPHARIGALLALAAPLVPPASAQDDPPVDQGQPAPSAQEEDATDLDTYTFEGTDWGLYDRRRLDGQAPASIGLTDAALPSGTWALRIQLWSERRDGLRDGRDSVSSGQAFAAGYAVAPTSQTNELAEIQVLHGWDDRWTVWGVLPLVRRELEADLSGGGTSRSEASGIGDVRLGANYLVHETDRERISVGLGLALPSGEFDARDTYGGVADALLPYTLQPGGGTFDLFPSAGWSKLYDDFAVGARALGRFPLGENSDDWALSRELDLDLWAQQQLNSSLSVSGRLNAMWWGDVHGDAPGLDPTNSPLEDAGLQGGTRVTLFAGLAWDLRAHEGVGSNRLELEIGVPIDERLDGPALSRDWMLRFGWTLGL